MITQTAKILTSLYRSNSLPSGDYYFLIAGSRKPQVGKYIKPSEAEKAHRSQNSLPLPQARFVSGEQYFIGNLRTLIVLAEVPPYQPQQEAQNEAER